MREYTLVQAEGFYEVVSRWYQRCAIILNTKRERNAGGEVAF